MAKRKRFGEILIEARVVNQNELTRALERQRGTGRRLGQVLEDMGVVTERHIAAALARQFGFKTVSHIAKAKISDAALALFDGKTALEKLLIPLKIEGSRLFLAMVNPLDIETIDSLEFRSSLRVVPCVTTPSEIQAAVNKHYFNILENVELEGHDPEVVIERESDKPTQSDKPSHSDSWWTILVVEDKDILRANVASLLKREGYHLLEASNGKEGLQQAINKQPHLILANTTEMPEMDGYAMFRAIQSNNTINKIPLIALSENTSVEEEAKLLEMGYHDFITKPINPVRLVARTRHALRLIYGGSPPPR